MADQKKSILEETLATIEDIKAGLGENSKYIMQGVIKEELNALLEANDDEEDDTEAATDLNPELDSDTEVEKPTDDSDDDMGDTGTPELPDETMDQDVSAEEIPTEPSSIEANGEPEMGGPEDEEEPGEIEDLRGMSNDEVLSVFKKMGPDDQVIVIRDEDNIHLKDGDNEYIISTQAGEPEMETPAVDLGTDVAIDESESVESTDLDNKSEEKVFEIEIPDTEEKPGTGEEEKEDEESVKKFTENVEKLDRLNEQLIKTRQKLAESVAKSKKLDDQIAAMNSVVNEYKLNEGEYKKAISALKTQLNEVATFTSNLTYVVKLITEHSTTTAEKKQILERFDKAANLNESRLTYESLVAEYSSRKKPVEETVQKIIEGSQLNSGSSKLNEQPVYQRDSQFTRIIELINKTK